MHPGGRGGDPSTLPGVTEHPDESTGRPPSFLRSSMQEQARIARIRPLAPPSLLLRVGRWWWATVLRESAAHFALVGVAALGLTWLVRLPARLTTALRALSVAAIVWELRNAWNAHRSVKRIDEALSDIETDGPSPRVPRSHLIVPPIAFVTRGVRRTRGVKYATAEDGTNLRLDVYRPADDDPADDVLQPAVIQVHGGGWLAGSRFEQGIPLLNHLASIGWVGFNVDYRLSPEATWPAQIVDVKRAIAWVRENAAELGIDPEMICITGGSAGGHLTALAGLTANAPEFQPGFEDADTSVAAAVPFYGVYDLTNANGHYYPQLNDWVFEKVLFKRPLVGNEDLYRSASPMHRMHADAPPFLVIHGERDTLVPVGDARDFVEAMRATSEERVLYVELPDAEHAFDLWPSERTARISEAIGRFLTAVAEREGKEPPPVREDSPARVA